MALTNDFDTATPLGSNAPSVIDNKIREVKAAVQERMNDHNGDADEGDHYWPLDGTEVSDDDAGQHRKVTLRNDWDHTDKEREDAIILHSKDVNGKAEAFALDEDGNDIQLTSGGVSSIGHSVTAKTEDYTVQSTELKNNVIFSNSGAGAVVTFTLPAGVAGYRVGFLVTDTDGIRINPPAGEQFHLFGTTTDAGNYISNSTVGGYVELVFDGTYWTIINMVGAWSEEGD